MLDREGPLTSERPEGPDAPPAAAPTGAGAWWARARKRVRFLPAPDIAFAVLLVVVLSGIAAYLLLKSEPAGRDAAPVPGSTTPTTFTPSTTAESRATTTAAPTTTTPPPTSTTTRATSATTTGPPQQSTVVTSAPTTSAPPPARVAPGAPGRIEYGPICGFVPSSDVVLDVNGQSTGTTRADENGCVRGVVPDSR